MSADKVPQDGANTTTLQKEDSEEVKNFNLARWLTGYLAFWIIMSIGFAMVSQILLPQKIKDLGASNPTAALGTMTAVGSIVALVANIIVGALSDMTKSKFGKRAPWLFWGAWFTLAFYLLMGYIGVVVGLTITLWLSKLSFNMMNSPIYSTVSDRVPEKYRGTISSAIGFGNTFGLAIGAWVGAKFINSVKMGFTISAILMFVSAMLFLIIIPRDKSNKDEPVAENGESLWHHIVYSFTPPLHAPDFWKAFCCRTLLLLAIQMLAGYWMYICEDYIGLPKESAAKVVSTLAILQMVASIVAMFVGPISDRIHRRKPMVVLAAALAVIGFAAPMIFRSVQGMYVAALFVSLGQGIFMAIDQALNVDVLPSKENAGKDLGFINAATTAGQSAGMALTSAIVSATGTYTYIFPIAIVMAVLSVVFVLSIKSVR
ncbi:MAG: MFS transporter [Bifidobacterium sp.]|nr:MFS transporter [Bifidobacterium sp.]